MVSQSETPEQIRRRKSRECHRITQIPSRMTEHAKALLKKQGKLDDILRRIRHGSHASRMVVVRTLDKIHGEAPTFRGDKYDEQIRDMAARGHSGTQIAKKLGLGASWVYNRASIIKVRFVRTMCDNGHKTHGRRVTWAGTSWCIMCLEEAHPGAFRRKVLREKAEHYEEVRANTVGWLGRQLEKASTAFHRADIKAELAKWGS